jgi:dienelactone hydrolase
MPPSLPVELATALAGRYRVDREVGRGGMAAVYRAEDLRHHRPVALKVLHPELAHALGAERFRREIEFAARLQHPRILTVFDSGEDEGRLWFTMPFVEGESLRARLQQEGPLPLDEARRIIRDVADALDYAHAQGVIHRDIKPENILLAHGHALVTDFGIARAAAVASADDGAGAELLTGAGVVIGTPTYMSPEQATGDFTLDARSDQYSLGCVAFELVTGAPPFADGSPLVLLNRRVLEDAPRARTLNPTVPTDVDAALARALARAPDERFPSVRAFAEALAPESFTPTEVASLPRWSRRTIGLAALGTAVTLAALAAFTAHRLNAARDAQWVARTGLPELARLAEGEEWDSAYVLAKRIEGIAPTDSTLARLWRAIAIRTVITSEPAGAAVWRTNMRDTSQWEPLGTTPTDSVWIPRRVGLFRFERDGARRQYRLGYPPLWTTVLTPQDAADSTLVRFAASTDRNGVRTIAMGPYAMEPFEVTNREYKQFVDAGGYTRPEFWTHPILDGSRTVPWSDAVRGFVDRTGRPGPATWEGGDFPAGEEAHPVGGVSWYEAAAYAAFRGRQLPPMAHWLHAAGDAPRGIAQYVSPTSNYGGKGAWPVGQRRGVAFGGLSDMAGNVREWTDTPREAGERYIMGGGWDDPAYFVRSPIAQRTLSRYPTNGIRLAQLDTTDPGVLTARAPLTFEQRNVAAMRPVSDEVFATYRQLFDYDPVRLDPVVEQSDTTERWIREVVHFASASGGEPLGVVLFIPRRPVGSPSRPLQTVVYFPSFYSFQSPLDAPTTPAYPEFAAWVVSTGRVLVFPMFTSTFRRRDKLATNAPTVSFEYRDHVILWGKEVRQTIDYLSTRADIDSTRVAFFGVSWGGSLGGIIPAIEPRIKGVLLYVAGIWPSAARPEADPVNYLPRVRQPVLMLNGKYDQLFSPDQAQEPFFRLLGTPAAQKQQVLYEDGHNLPFTEVMKRGSQWLDALFGPVR